MYPANARSTNIGTANNLGGNQTRSSANQGTMPSPPTQQGLGKGLKTSSNTDPLRQLNFNHHHHHQQQQQQQSSRQYGQQSSSTAHFDGQDQSYGNQRRSTRQQQEYNYNDFNAHGNNTTNNNTRRNNQNYAYAEWPRVNNAAWDNGYRQQQQQQQPQRYSRQQQQQQQNYDSNRFYPSRRKLR
jgi:hypothetical protein